MSQYLWSTRPDSSNVRWCPGRSLQTPSNTVSGAVDVAASLERASQVGVVVDLAVEHQGQRAVLVEQRLVAALEIHNGQPPEAQACRTMGEIALIVGTPVAHRLAHARAYGRV